MPLFEGAKPIANSRSNARLSVSQVFSPAERWIHDPALPQLFEYSYGGPGHVVLTKGTIVAFGGTAVEDYETGKHVFPITYADGTNTPIGVLPYNVYQKVNDRLLGNQPSILTHEYIELPLIVGISNVYDLTGLTGLDKLLLKDIPTKMKMKWGCCYAYDTAEYLTLKPGDFLKSDKFGKFVKWSPEQLSYSATVSSATSDTFNTLNTAESFSANVEESFTTTSNGLEYTLTKGGTNGGSVGAIVSITLADVALEVTTDYTYAAGKVTLIEDPGADKALVVTFTTKAYTLAATNLVAVKSVTVGTTALAADAYALTDGVVTLDDAPTAGATVSIVSYKAVYTLTKATPYSVAVEVADENFANFTFATPANTVTLTASPAADEIVVNYNSPSTTVASVSVTTTGDKPEQIVGQVLAIESGTDPLGWLKWVTPVVETGERAIDDNNLDAPDAQDGYLADPNYRFPLDLSGSYTSPGPWKDYNGIPGLTDGAVSQLGTGILPGWDFAGSVGAIRIALRY